MKPPPFEYFAPTSLDDAVQMLGSYDNAKLLAGGQSLVPMLNMRFVMPEQVIDLNRVAELTFIRDEGDEIIIGAMTRQRAIERSALLRERMPVFAKALRYVGHLQTRNRGTIGGSLCQLDPSAELPALAAAYDAEIEVMGPNSRRSIPIADFPAYYMTPSLQTDEILTAVRFRPWAGRCASGFREFARRHGDFAIAGAVALLQADDIGRITRVSVAILGIGHAPIRVARAESLLSGQVITDDILAAAADSCLELDAMDDAYASADYRRNVARAMALCALREAADELNAH